jgi:cation diffusion facilitator CzcD-associated flavoprotein CzcO
MTTENKDAPDYEVIVIGAGLCGIYQLYRLVQAGISATVIEKGADLGGTWFWNRYPGARFDSESYAYGYSFSTDILQEWNWSERFASQPETLKYLNFVADRFDLRKHMQFNTTVSAANFDDDSATWHVITQDGRELTSRFVVAAVGLLSAPTTAQYEGAETFEGQSFHTFDWPDGNVQLAGKRVAVIGTGSTGVQIIAEIADKVGELTVFQRHPNWCAPLHNAPLSAEEMAAIKARYDEIFAMCARTPAGHLHEPDPRSYFEVTREERLAKWEELYAAPGFGIWLANFPEVLSDLTANADMSAFVAGKIRARVHDPATAEKLIPKDHGFGTKRVPLETRYYEAYNRGNVSLVDLLETPITRITPTGIRTSDRDYDLDVIIYATGFDAVTGAYERMDIRGTGGTLLRDKWSPSPRTFYGIMVPGFPNFLMPTGPQSGSASSNFPRGIEMGVDWVTDLITHMHRKGIVRAEADEEAADQWGQHVRRLYDRTLLPTAKSWFTGYNSNVEGRGAGMVRYVVYPGSGRKYRERITRIANEGYPGVDLR